MGNAIEAKQRHVNYVPGATPHFTPYELNNIFGEGSPRNLTGVKSGVGQQ